MQAEEGWQMYIEIQHLKGKGFSKSKISKMLKISRPTVIRYINMSPEDFQEEPAVYHDDILTWVRQYPEMTASQIYDWLEEKYQELGSFNNSPTQVLLTGYP